MAVVAEDTWAALQGQRALEATWDEGGFASLSSVDLREQYKFDFAADSRLDPNAFHAVYEVPFFAHAPTRADELHRRREVEDRCEVWAPTQNPGETLSRISFITGLPRENIQINIPRVGGGFRTPSAGGLRGAGLAGYPLRLAHRSN